ncbi:Importin-5 [Hondaea fermentalgiana]|uniref:Importin-5 n=1 Tax=Hondaea fermentalgiana TaxID=2315210 RepID=A0A2R5GS32_9STRA|nr:Importin-5 [Hondaea fermentalgiana]|eukprot:GBG31453.1 Importin-5 [Hondaea fermentalgiana]
MVELTQVLSALLSVDNNTRGQAEKVYHEMLKADPGRVVASLVENAASAQVDLASRHLALVLTRRAIRGEAWHNMAAHTKQGAVKLIVDLLEREDNVRLDMMAVHALVVVPAQELAQNGQLVGWAIEQLSKVGSEKRVVFLFLLGKLAEFCFDLVKPHVRRVIEVLGQCVQQTQEVETQLFASEAVCQVALSFERPQELRSFLEDALPAMLDAVSRGLGENSSQRAQDQAVRMLEALDALSAKCMWAFDKSLGPMCVSLLQLAERASLDDGTRCQALSLFVELARKRSKLALGGDAGFVDNLLRLLLRLQCEDEDWLDDWAEDFHPSPADMLLVLSPGMRGSALSSLETLAASVSAEADKENFLSAIFKSIVPALQSGAPAERLAGVSSMGVLAGALGKQMRSSLGDLVHSTQNLCRDADSRVQYMALAALRELVLSPGLKGAFRDDNAEMGASILSTMLAVLEAGASAPVVRSCACRGLEAFLDEELCPTEQIEGPQTQRLIRALVACLQNGSVGLQEDAMMALGQVAAVAGAGFGAFYEELVPGIKQVIAAPAGQAPVSSRQNGGEGNQDAVRGGGALRGAAMSCIAAIAEAVGKERFQKDADEVMGLLLQASADDFLAQDGIFDFCKRVSVVLGDDFVPYLPHVLPIIYRALDMDVGLNVQDVLAGDGNGAAGSSSAEAAAAGMLDDSNGLATVTKDVRGAGTYRVTANVYVLQMRVNALDALDSIADAVGAGMSPFLEEALTVVLPAINDKLNVYAAVKAAEGAASLLHAAWKSLFEQGHTMEPAQKLLVTICTALLSGLEQASQTDPDEDPLEHSSGPEHRAGFASAFERCMRICWFSGGEDYDEESGRPQPELVPPLQLVPQMVNVLRSVAARSVQRRAEAVLRMNNAGYEAEAIEEYMEELNEWETEFMTDIIDSIGYILKLIGPPVLPVFDEILHPFLQVILVDQSDALRHNAMCLYDDIIEYGGAGAHKYLDTCYPAMIQYAQSDHEPLQQSAIYGIGQVAEHAPKRFAQDAGRVVQLLSTIITQPDAREEDNIDVTENAVSVLGKVYAHHKQNVPATELMQLWLQHLPLTEDLAEAKYSHRLLVRLLAENDAGVLGPNQANLSQILRVLAALLATVTENEKTAESGADDDDLKDIVDKYTEEALPDLLSSMLKSAPDAQRMVAQLPQASQQVIQDLLS